MSKTAESSKKTIPVRLDLDEESHQALRVVAAKAKKSMSSYVRHLVLESIRRQRDK